MKRNRGDRLIQGLVRRPAASRRGSGAPSGGSPKAAGGGTARQPRGGAARRPARGAGMRADQRGVALIMVTAVVAILTAVAVEFTYRQRVAMHLAANARDELRAEYLAKSGVELARLLLSFQQQIDNIQIPGMDQIIQAMSGGGPGQQPTLPGMGAGGAAGGGGGLGIRLWELVPLDSGLIQLFLGMVQGTGEPEQPLDPNAPVLAPFGDFQGGFSVEIRDEDSRINVNQLRGLGRQQTTALVNLVSLMQDPAYDFLFDEEDRWGVRMTRPETIGALRDYIDENQVQDSIVVTQAGPELLPGSGDESYYYSRFEPRSQPKNAAFDSIDELYMVAGVSDFFMSAFGDQLTVYTDKNSKLNATPQTLQDLQLRCYIGAELASQRYCFEPALMTTIWTQLQEMRAMMPWLGISPSQLKAVLEGNGIATNMTAFEGPNAVFGNSSKTFTIKVTGQAGDIQKTITAVVRMGDSGSNQASGPLGTLLHWTER